MTSQHFVKESKCGIHADDQLSQQKLGVEMVIQEGSVETHLSNDVEPYNIHRRPTRLLRILS